MSKQTFTTGQILTAAQMTTLQANDYNQTVNAKVASYTLVATDAGTRITMSNASATTITVNTALFTAGDTLTITNIGAGVCTITAGTATVSSGGSLALAQYDSGILYFSSTSAAIWNGANPGDITGVTAGTGISGGGTSGAVTITNSMATEITAKADLIVGTGNAAFDNLPVGANGTVLTADSTVSPTGLKWATPSSGGMTLINTGGTALSGASVTVGSIPSTHTNLYILMLGYYTATADAATYVRFNSDTGAKYTYAYVRNINTTLAGSSSLSSTSAVINTRTIAASTAAKTSNAEINVMRYAESTANKFFTYSSGAVDPNTDGVMTMTGNANFASTSAISSVTVYADFNFSGGTIYVYGVN
jgi:hypothetical protein